MASAMILNSGWAPLVAPALGMKTRIIALCIHNARFPCPKWGGDNFKQELLHYIFIMRNLVPKDHFWLISMVSSVVDMVTKAVAMVTKTVVMVTKTVAMVTKPFAIMHVRAKNIILGECPSGIDPGREKMKERMSQHPGNTSERVLFIKVRVDRIRIGQVCCRW
eukprot:sb/3472602/